jgi:hypothetical protein
MIIMAVPVGHRLRDYTVGLHSNQTKISVDKYFSIDKQFPDGDSST